MTVVGFVLYGSLVLLPIMLQTLLGYPPLQAGIAMAPRGIGVVLHDAAHRPHDRASSIARKLLTVGLIIGGVTLIWLSRLNLQAGYWDIFWPQLIQGVGMSLLFVPLTTVSMDPIPRETHGQRDEPVQPDAQHRRQHRHRHDRHDARAAIRSRRRRRSART